MPFSPLSRTETASLVSNAESDLGGSTAVSQQSHARDFLPRIRWILAWFALVAAALIATKASAQEKYKAIPLSENLSGDGAIRTMEVEVRNFINGADANSQAVAAYFGRYVPAKLTDLNNLVDAPKLIADVNKYLRAAQRSRNPAVMRSMNRYIVGSMRPIAIDPEFHPLARINAILLISKLNQRPADTINRTPPTPLLAAMGMLSQIYADENEPAGVRAAALQGLHRHVMLGFPAIASQPDRKANLTKLMTELLESDPPAGRDRKVHAYLQRYAVDMLTVLGESTNPTLGETLVSISHDEKRDPLIAFHSAASLAKLDPPSLAAAAANPDETLKKWTRRTVEMFESELARLEGLERPNRVPKQPRKPETYLKRPDAKPDPTNFGGGSRTGGGMPMGAMGGAPDMGDIMSMMGGRDGGGGMGSMMGGPPDMGDFMGPAGMMGVREAKPQPPQVQATRGRLNYVLEQLHLAVTGSPKGGTPRRSGGLLAAVSEENKEPVTAWITMMEAFLEDLNDDELDTQVLFVEELQERIDELKEYVGDPVEDLAAQPASNVADGGDRSDSDSDEDAEDFAGLLGG